MPSALIEKSTNKNRGLQLALSIVLLYGTQAVADGSYRISVKDFSADPAKVKRTGQTCVSDFEFLHPKEP
ncbi:MAG: hypothetical protein K2W88_05130, partial [Pararheinheimera sp.]|nr:hypothetical protein [Rheinheimera sp.]